MKKMVCDMFLCYDDYIIMMLNKNDCITFYIIIKKHILIVELLLLLRKHQ